MDLILRFLTTVSRAVFRFFEGWKEERERTRFMRAWPLNLHVTLLDSCRCSVSHAGEHGQIDGWDCEYMELRVRLDSGEHVTVCPKGIRRFR